jgi:hypothetical protein
VLDHEAMVAGVGVRCKRARRVPCLCFRWTRPAPTGGAAFPFRDRRQGQACL